MTWDEHEGLPVAVYQEGMFFGDFEVYKNTQRLFSCKALTELKLLILEKKDFKRIFFRTFPQLGKLFVREMNNKFYNLEYTMEVLHNNIFPDFSNQEGKDKIQLVKGERLFLSRVSSTMNNHMMCNFLEYIKGGEIDLE